QKWADILALPAGQRHLSYSSAVIEPQVSAAFAAPGPGWASARYYSPDIMVEAADIQAINRGEFRYVLGELHLSANTLAVSLFTQQHPHIQDLYDAMAQSHLLPATRSQPSLTLPKDFRLLTSTDMCDAPADRLLRAGDLFVEERNGSIWVRTSDGNHTFDALDVFENYFSLVVVDDFAIQPSDVHTPRIAIDRLVVTREAWRVPVEEIARVDAKDAGESYLNLYRWAREQGMPQYLFYRTPAERKPCFLDLSSPLSVDLFVREVRHLTSHAD